MKKYQIIAIVSVLVAALFGCQPDKHEKIFMSYNVKNCIGMDGAVDYARVAGVITQVNPDVVAIQELDSVTGRSKNLYVLGELAKHTGMHPTYAPAINYDGGKYGIGILSKEEPVKVYRHPLPGREESRMLLVVEFQDYVYCCMHLSLTDEDRMASLPIIKEATSGFSKPLFIAGDWNATPDSPFIQAMQEDFTILTDLDKFTCPSDTPRVTIDYIALRQTPAVNLYHQESHVISAPVESDHLPVMVGVVWKKK